MVDIGQSTFWTSAVLIGSGVRHVIEHDEGLACTLYFDPDCEASIGLNGFLERQSFVTLSGSLERVVRRFVWRVIASGTQAERAFEEFSMFLGSPKTGRRCDQRIMDAQASLYESGSLDRWPLAGLAETAGLSPTRFATLFKECTGLPLRGYLRWLRAQRVLQALAKGMDPNSAAKAAGYSSAAHCTNTFRHMFGIPPTMFAKALRYRG